MVGSVGHIGESRRCVQVEGSGGGVKGSGCEVSPSPQTLAVGSVCASEAKEHLMLADQNRSSACEL